MTGRRILGALALVACFGGSAAVAQDWTQWRGTHRDAAATGFDVPESWPDELVKKWSLEVGDGVSSPSLSDNRIYIMALQGSEEVMRCLDAESGDEIWSDRYAARGAGRPAADFAGTRSAPAIAEGHIVAMGVDGTVSCWNAENGELKWRNEEYRGKVPRFSTSSSPLIHDSVAFIQFGGDQQGGIAAYDLATGDVKWQWTEDGTAYASPVLIKVGDENFLLAPTAHRLVAVSVNDGKSAWSMDYTQGRYNAATPVVDGSKAYFAGPNRGITALEFSKSGDGIESRELWRNEDEQTTALYNSAVIADGNLYGLSSGNQLFCVSIDGGAMAWNHALPQAPGGGGNAQRPPRGDQDKPSGEPGAGGDQRRPEGAGGGQGGRGGRGGRGGGGRGGYGSIVSAGDVLLGLTPASELFVYRKSDRGYEEIARYKVAETPTYAYPVLAGKRIYIKDKNHLTLWTLE